MRRPAGLAALVIGLSASIAVPSARADPPPSTQPSPSGAAEATRHYEEGSRLLQEGSREQALQELRASAELLPSPNTDLLIAHCLRELGRRTAAMETYERVLRAATERLRSGDERFRPTAADAQRWISTLRATLGELRVTVERAPRAAALTIDGSPTEAEYEERTSTLRVRQWHEPGPTSIEVRAPGGRSARASPDVKAGASSDVHLVFPAQADEHGGGPSPAPLEGRNGPPTASWVAAGVGVAALGVFAGFGARAASIQSDLESCAPYCPATRYGDEADEGRRDATIANLSLAASAAALLTAGLLWALWPRDQPHTARAAGRGHASRPLGFPF